MLVHREFRRTIATILLRHISFLSLSDCRAENIWHCCAFIEKKGLCALSNDSLLDTWQRGRVSQNTERKPDNVPESCGWTKLGNSYTLIWCWSELITPTNPPQFGLKPRPLGSAGVVVSHLDDLKPSLLSLPTVSLLWSGTGCQRGGGWEWQGGDEGTKGLAGTILVS